MHPSLELPNLMTRRHFFGKSATGIGSAVLASMLSQDRLTAMESVLTNPATWKHIAPKAKRVVYLFMAGAPAQMDLLDYKPKMNDWFDKDLPKSIIDGQRLTTMTSGQTRFPIAPSKFKFQQYGQSGAWVSELLPHTSKIVDDICIVKSMFTEAINHDPAITFIQTGSQLPGRPSLGAWLSYGLGHMNENLPAFIVMTPTWSARRDAQALYTRLWGTGFLPEEHAGVALRAQGDPVLYLNDPPGIDRKARRSMLDALSALNRKQYKQVANPEIHARIEQYEMAFRMQTSVPELTDISNEPKHILDLYGPDATKKGTYAASCLLARRMLERDVRFIQIFHRGWDQHGNLPSDLTNQCRDVDQPTSALIQDLKQRGMLEDTLVIWGGEFGRTVYCQGGLTKENYGRDHHPRCFTIWMAGAGVKKGMVYGETDDFSYNIITKDKQMHIHDLNATLLHILGIDHTRLTYRFQGREFRLTDVFGKVNQDVLS